VAIAFRAGALVQDMEFIQFHPTAFCHPRAPRYLLTEALRGEGAVIRDGSGVRFLPEYDRAAELAPRDVVTRAIHDRMVRTGAGWVYLDATSIPSDRLFARFPTICRFLAEYAIDPSRQWIPVAPAAHYMIGGVATDASGRTTVPGLLACGEAAATGVHGANRLASNSLLEGLVFGERVAALLRHPRRGAPRAPPVVRRLRMVPGDHAAAAKEVASGVRELLWSHVGITRDAAGLSSSLARLEAWARQVEPSSREDLPRPEANAVLMARLVAEAAFSREESRGAHFRSDYPRPNPTWRRHLGLRAGSAD
jgi:L-aspartate oxidase